VLDAVGYNFRLLLNWLKLARDPRIPFWTIQTSNRMKIEKFTGDEFRIIFSLGAA
jgi:hypothetical protein